MSYVWLEENAEPFDAALFEAFIAGFDASGEGFNGEYVGDRFRGDANARSPAFWDRMQAQFAEWRASRVT